LFLGLDTFFLEFLDFTGKHSGSINSGIDTRGLDGDDDVTIVLQKVMSVEGYKRRGIDSLLACYHDYYYYLHYNLLMIRA
jgi:hypothetical protein